MEKNNGFNWKVHADCLHGPHNSNKTACIAWAIVEFLLLSCLSGTIHAAISRHANVSKTSNLIASFRSKCPGRAAAPNGVSELASSTVEEQQQRHLPFLQEDASHRKIVQVADSCLLIVREITPSLNHGWKNFTPITLK